MKHRDVDFLGCGDPVLLADALRGSGGGVGGDLSHLVFLEEELVGTAGGEVFSLKKTRVRAVVVDKDVLGARGDLEEKEREEGGGEGG